MSQLSRIGLSTLKSRWLLLAALALGSAATACSEPVIEPQIASSSPHAGYARAYPDAVSATISDFGGAQERAKELSGGMSSYPDALEGDVDYDAVADMFERASAVGKSHAFVERIEEVQGAQVFFTEEKDEINKKVAGSVAYVAKQANCTADVSSAAVTSLDKVVKERLEERLREANDAHRMLEQNRTELGKKNAAALETQLDEVAESSYLVHIALVRHKLKLRRLIAEADDVAKTADAAIEEENAYQQKEGLSDADKEASNARIQELKQAKSSMSSAKKSAERTEADMEKRIEKAQKAHQQAVDKLVESLRKRAQSSS